MYDYIFYFSKEGIIALYGIYFESSVNDTNKREQLKCAYLSSAVDGMGLREQSTTLNVVWYSESTLYLSRVSYKFQISIMSYAMSLSPHPRQNRSQVADFQSLRSNEGEDPDVRRTHTPIALRGTDTDRACSFSENAVFRSIEEPAHLGHGPTKASMHLPVDRPTLLSIKSQSGVRLKSGTSHTGNQHHHHHHHSP